MEENFSRMQELMISGHSPHEARQQTIQESSEQLEPRAKVTRSSSQPPPIDTLKPRVPRIESPLVKKTTETPIRRTSYVDTLVATHQIQLQYSDRVVVGVERQMTKLESIKVQELENFSKKSVKPDFSWGFPPKNWIFFANFELKIHIFRSKLSKNEKNICINSHFPPIA